MSIKDYLGLGLSVSVGSAMIWSSLFDDNQMIAADLLAMPGGRYKFLTILNLYLQIVYYLICILNFFVGTNVIYLKNTSKLQIIRDYLFATAVFPMALFVGLTFWSLYHIDRRLIFPEEAEQFLPPLLNHTMHTLPAIAILIENLLHYHHYPSRFFGVFCTLLITGAYAAWLHYLNYIHYMNARVNLWIYPILNELSATYRILFFLGSSVFTVGLYFIGEMYTKFLIEENSSLKKKH